MTLIEYFEQFINFLQQHQESLFIPLIYAALHGLVVLFRLILFFGYRGQNLWLAADTQPGKQLKKLSDATALRSGLLRKIVANYVQVAQKNAANIPVADIVEKQLLRLNFMGWRYSGMAYWIEKLESGLIFLGLALAFAIPPYSALFALLAILGFLLLKLFAALFDYSTARFLLSTDINVYLAQEVGQFFATTAEGAVLKFKEEMAEAIDRQTVMLRSATEKLAEDLAPIITQLQPLANLPKALEDMQQNNDRYALHHEGFLAQSQIIKDAQAALEKSLASYETTLQNIYKTMGDSLGTFIELYGQNAAAALNDSLQEHITKIEDKNREVTATLTTLINSLSTQNRDISTHLRILDERISEL
ncbi:MAG: hypothetical protein FWG68_05035 [Defluviitaleaceae bacterium]|nr:hypothetical protein [Defluviitaleaceae bacterium]